VKNNVESVGAAASLPTISRGHGRRK
jgi:hypothetical protein